MQEELLKTGGILLLDGLDEIPEAELRRTQIKQVVEDFAKTYPRCRIMVTSRTYAYQEDWRLSGFSEAILSPFNKGQISSFVDLWYAHVSRARGMNREDAGGRAKRLKDAIFKSDPLVFTGRATPPPDAHGMPACMARWQPAGKTGGAVCRHRRFAAGLVGKPAHCAGQ